MTQEIPMTDDRPVYTTGPIVAGILSTLQTLQMQADRMTGESNRRMEEMQREITAVTKSLAEVTTELRMIATTMRDIIEKQDIAQKLQTEVAVIETEIKQVKTNQENGFRDIDKRMESQVQATRWLIGLLVPTILAVIGLFLTVLKK